MATDPTIRELYDQIQQQPYNRLSLRLGTCIIRISVRIKTTLIAYSNTVLVISGHMSRNQFQRSHRDYLPILPNIIVITRGIESSRLMISL